MRGFSKANSLGRTGDKLENPDIQTETKLEDYASMAEEMRNAEVGIKYVKDGKSGWTQVLIKGGGRRVLGVKMLILVGMQMLG